jgi:hypothetical protein
MLPLIKRLKLAGRVLLKGDVADRPRRSSADIPALSAEEAAEARLFFPLDKFFIFGHARSGTTLLTRLVRLHPKVHCNYQAHFFTRSPLLEGLVADPEVGAWLSRRSNRWNRGRDLSPVVLRAASDFILEREARAAGKGAPGCTVGDKSPNSLLDGKAVHLMNKLYPDGRLIFIVRDGRDAAISHRFQAFVENPDGLPSTDQQIRRAFSEDPADFLSGVRSIFTEKGIRQAAAGWVKNVTETDLAARTLLGERYCSVRYEDLLQNPLEEMRRLWYFLGVDARQDGLEGALTAELAQNPDADWQQHKAGEIAAPLQKGQRGTWREVLTPRDRAIFAEVAGETLTAWNYVKEI